MPRGDLPVVKINEGLTPEATPYDTYVRPSEPQRSPLHDLATSLAGFSEELNGLVKKRVAAQAEDDSIRGKAAFWDDNKDGAAEGVRKGIIPAFASPHFVRGYQEAAGEAAGKQLDGRIGQSYTDNFDKTSDDPEAFDKFFRSEVQSIFASGNQDPGFLKGAEQEIKLAHSKYYGIWQKDRQQLTLGKAEASFTAAMGASLDGYWRAGQGSEKGVDLVGAGGAISQFRDNAYKIGLEKTKADQLAVDAVVAKAIEYKDERILQALSTVKDLSGPQLGDKGGAGNPVSLAEAAYGRDHIAAATKAIQSAKHADAERAHTQQTRLDAADKQDALRDITTRLIKDPQQDIPEELYKRGEKTDGNFRADIIALRGNILNGNKQEDPAKIAALTKDIIAGKGMDAYRAAIGAGDIKDPASIKNAYELIQLVEKNNQGDMKILDGSGWQRIEKMIQTKFVDPAYKGSIYKEAGLTADGDAAMNDARIEVMKWAVANPNASRIEQEDFLQKVGQRYRDTMGEDRSGNKTYTQPPDVNRDTTAPVGTTEPAPPAAMNPALKPGERTLPPKVSPLSNLTQQLQTGTAAPKVTDLVKNGLDKAEYDKFITESKALGYKDPQIRLDRMFKSIQEHRKLQQQEAKPPGKRSDAGGSAVEPTTSANIPGLGSIDFAGLDPSAVASIKSAIDQHAPGLLQKVQGTTTYATGTDHMAVAEQFLGMNEKQHAAPLAEFFKIAGGTDLNPAKTAWCARFANSVLAASGHKNEVTHSDLARSFLKVGEAVEPRFAQAGDIIVFPREGGSGHVGFIKSVKGDNVEVLSGNHNNAVAIGTYSLKSALGIRRINQQHAMGPIPGDEAVQTA